MNDLYYVVHIQVMTDGTHAQATTEYSSLDEARSAMWSMLSSDAISTTLATYSATILNYHCGQEKVEYVDNPTPNPISVDTESEG